jgi:hypothetical protein
MGTLQAVSCKPFDKPTVHRVACPSTLFPSRQQSSTDVLDLLVQCFCLATCLRVVWSSDIMTDPMFCQVFAKVLVNKVSAPITNHHSWDSKPCKYHFFKYLLRVSRINSSAWHSFDSFGNIVDCH